jgi:hypothetical protein
MERIARERAETLDKQKSLADAEWCEECGDYVEWCAECEEWIEARDRLLSK